MEVCLQLQRHEHGHDSYHLRCDSLCVLPLPIAIPVDGHVYELSSRISQIEAKRTLTQHLPVSQRCHSWLLPSLKFQNVAPSVSKGKKKASLTGVIKSQPNNRYNQTVRGYAGCGCTAQKILGKKRTVSRVFFLFTALVVLVANLVATGKSFSTAHH
ncbi:LAQU0S17e02124g1_1 [Lachancea quebecensis]|uniref:LAQU0S17e02124g1_1 n=1 Tax=Lachancea quebecensis TaxID=1654605 RepID=A0A0N7MMA8_9SACH|nr:LAQU0S17e02124g1_1 [Lachancea quebecensis]